MKKTRFKVCAFCFGRSAVISALIMAGWLAAQAAETGFAGGEGTVESPYVVATLEQLQEMRRHRDSHFVLAADIDASPTSNWNRKDDYEGVAAGKSEDGPAYSLPHSPLEAGTVKVYVDGVERSDGFLIEYSDGRIVFEGLPHELYGLGEEKESAAVTVDYRTAYAHYRGFDPVRRFSGTFDGGGNRIRGLYINRPDEDFVGLIGNSVRGSRIMNVGLENVNIAGRTRVGGLAGNSYSTVDSCYTTGSVSGDYRVGGLAGVNFENTVANSYSRADAGGDALMIGGLIGLNYRGTVKNSYSTGRVSGARFAGGLIGLASPTSEYEITGSFWDVESSGMTTATRGEGLVTADMRDIGTFRDAGWDIAHAGEHGDETWKIESGKDYPRLGWE